eukprot:Sspe_Gene.78060::Locus_48819_Transcript_1_1_Confidence_1.000_Length_1584::g.78060::m.78060/K03231/EEF1A; elongation factor 1-alpha
MALVIPSTATPPTSSRRKPHLNVITLGHSGGGKSTTVGHLIYKCGGIDPSHMRRIEKEATDTGKGSCKYAWVLDRLKHERDRCATITLHMWKYRTNKHTVTWIDAPGHSDFAKNLVTGTACADAGLLVVSAVYGEFEAGMGRDGQTREHAILAYTLGIKQLIVAVNKMDDRSVAFSKERYDEIRRVLLDYLKKVGYNVEGKSPSVVFVPLSSLLGENLVDSSPRMAWYCGPTLIESLELFETPYRADGPLRIPIQEAFKVTGAGVVVVGRVEQGQLRVGDEVVLAPGGGSGTVRSIEMHHEPLEGASSGDTIGFSISDHNIGSIKKGMVAYKPAEGVLRECSEFTAHIVVLHTPGAHGIAEGYTPILNIHTAHVAARIDRLISRVDRRCGAVVERSDRMLRCGDAAVVRIIPTKPICVEPFLEVPTLGRFALRDMRQIVAAGVIKSVTYRDHPAPHPPAVRSHSDVATSSVLRP